MTILDPHTFIKYLLREFHFTSMVRMSQLGCFDSARDRSCDQVVLTFGLSLGHFVLEICFFFKKYGCATSRNIRWGRASRCRTRGPLDNLGRLTKEQHVTQSNRKGHGLQQLMHRRLSSMGKCGNRKRYCRSQRGQKSRVNAERHV